MSKEDYVDHPNHYNCHPSGVECIDLSEHLLFNLGNAFKYIFRKDHKAAYKQDLEKALWYVKRERERIAKMDDGKFEELLASKFNCLIEDEQDVVTKRLFQLIWEAEFGGTEFNSQDEYLDAIIGLLIQTINKIE